MANQRRRDRQRRATRGQQASTLQFGLPYDRRNAMVFGAALATIILGYLLLAQPPVDGFLSLTLAPILLVIGYVILIPMALLLKPEGEADGDQTTEDNV